MARIIGGLGSSHTPTIGFAHDANKQSDPVWAPIFEAFKDMKSWLEEKQPDVIFIIYNDHITSFFFDHYSPFSLGFDEEFQCADEGGGARDMPPLKGHPKLAQHIGEHMMAAEFDLSFFQRRPLDHGCFSPMSVLFDPAKGWPVQIVPLNVGVLQNPVPTPRRCWKFGQELRKAIESYPEDISVAILATGGLSHQVHGERNGFLDEEWDQQFLDLITNDPEEIASMSQAELAYRGGWEGSEVAMWLIMRGALSANVKKLSSSYCAPSMTGIATLLLENYTAPARTPMPDKLPELAPPLSYPFDLAVSVANFELNKFFNDMIMPAHRALFLKDEEASLAASQLTDEQKDLIRRRDWRGLLQAGAIFFGLEKFAAVLGQPNNVVYAAMKGMSVEDFQATRNAPGAVYGVGSSLRANS